MLIILGFVTGFSYALTWFIFTILAEDVFRKFFVAGLLLSLAATSFMMGWVARGGL